MRQATPYQLDTLEKAIQLYEGLASGKFGLYNHQRYKFLERDAAVLQDRALALRNLKRELQNDR